MGRTTGSCQRQGRNVWWLLCRRYADARRDVEAASFGGDFSLRDRVRVLRRLDLSERSVDAVVRQFMDFRARH